jgi:hypothetical protein
MPNEKLRQRGEPTIQPNIGGPTAHDGNGYGRRPRTKVAWGDIEPDTISRLVVRLCDNGYGLVLGKTSDGGALSITVLDGEQRVKDWPTTIDDFNKFVEWALQSFGVAD